VIESYSDSKAPVKTALYAALRDTKIHVKRFDRSDYWWDSVIIEKQVDDNVLKD